MCHGVKGSGLMTFEKVRRVTREEGPKMANIQYRVKPDYL